MNIKLIGVAVVVCAGFAAGAQLSPLSLEQQNGAVGITERGADFRTWRAINRIKNESGQDIDQIVSYREIATGMHYKNSQGAWEEAQERIDPYPGGAIAQFAQHKVSFATDLNSEGAVDVLSADQKRFRSQVLGLSFYDFASGRSVSIAGVTNSIGVLISANQVLYQNAFSGLTNCHVRYTLTKSGLEQDIVITERLPFAPEDFGMNSETTVLEVITEFLSPPTPNVTATNLLVGTDASLNFGAMQIVSGTAFSAPAAGGQDAGARRVLKDWITDSQSGRTFLVEKVTYAEIKSTLDNLPAVENRVADAATLRKQVVSHRIFPAGARGRGLEKPFMFASVSLPPSLVVDYAMVITSTNLTFQGDSTYFVSGPVNLAGTTILEGGAVIKFANTNNAQINITGANGYILCKTAAFRPAVFTASDDNSVGSTISGSTGLPNGFYAAGALLIDANSTGIASDLNHIRISYASKGIIYNGGGLHSLRNVQFVNCNVAVVATNATCAIRNGLIFNAQTGGLNYGSSISSEQLTFNQIGTLISASGGSPTATFTNSLLISVTNMGSGYAMSSNCIASASSGASVFQTIGAGGHYLTAGSIYRNAGTTNIDQVLLNDLSQSTTYPPITYQAPGGYFSSNLTLFPQAQRDSDVPDLGYHYDPIDYAFGFLYATNSTITVKPGTTIAVFNSYGITVADGSTFICEGTAGKLNRIVHYNTVQEQANTNWVSLSGPSVLTPWLGVSPPPTLRFRFTDWSVLASDAPHFHGYNFIAGMAPIVMQDCGFHGGQVLTEGTTTGFTNCLFERAWAQAFVNNTNAIVISYRNCTFLGGSCDADFCTSNQVTCFDSIFDHTTINQVAGSATHNYNAYFSGSNRFTPNAANDVILDELRYEVGPLGAYYIPTNSAVINAGSQTADFSGLYHYTTSLAQTKETNSTVDIGFHYVAVSTTAVLNTLWVDDFVPDDPAYQYGDGGDSWNWITGPPAPVSGTKVHQANTSASSHQHYFNNATNTLSISAGDIIYAFVYLDPTNLPSQIVLQFFGTGDGWNHRAYWGIDAIGWNPDVYLGALPSAGKWARLSVPAKSVQLEGKIINGMAFSLYGGSAGWDAAGKYSVLSQVSFPDADGDGIPDYLEDRNGNGSVDTAETDWTSASDLGFSVRIDQPKSNPISP